MLPTENNKSVNLYRSFYLILTFMNDSELGELILKNFQRRCEEDDSETLFKRSGDEKVVGKKIKFHSWGGKRTIEDFIPKVKVANRAPFHSWGGKRGGGGALI